jgi:hypothetical protein
MTNRSKINVSNVLKHVWHNVAPMKVREYRGKKVREQKIKRTLNGNDYIFIHIPKAAGSSIGNALIGHDKPGHFSIQEYMSASQDFLLSKFTFTFTRHPVSRFISAYNYLTSAPKNESDRRFAKQVMSNYNGINGFILDFLTSDKLYSHIHFYPQTYFLVCNDILAVDFIGRFENLTTDFDHVCTIIGKTAVLPHSNKTQDPGGETCLCSDAVEKLYDLYQKDFQLLGYHKK